MPMLYKNFKKDDDNVMLFFVDGIDTPVEMVSFPISKVDTPEKLHEFAVWLNKLTEDLYNKYSTKAVQVKSFKAFDNSYFDYKD